MAERKIPYIIELAANDAKLRKQMSSWNWEDIMGKSKGKSFKDALVSDVKGVEHEILSTFNGLNIDWSKILGKKELGQLEQLVTKVIAGYRKDLEKMSITGDTKGLQTTIDYTIALGKELKELGSSFDAASLARGMGAFMKVLTPLTQKFEQFADKPKDIEAAFDRMFSGVTIGANNALRSSEKIVNVMAKIETATKRTGGSQESLDKLVKRFDELKNIKLPDLSSLTLTQLEGEMEKLEDKWDALEQRFAGKNKNNSTYQLERGKLLAEERNIAQAYNSISGSSGLDADYISDIDKQLKQIHSMFERAIEKLQQQLSSDDFAQAISKQLSNININLSLDEQSKTKFINEINTFVKDVNKTPFEKVKIGVKQVLDDVSNPIEDKTKRGYKKNATDEDAATTELVNKTKDRFDRVGSVIRSKQSRILHNTKKWRKQMLKAMEIGKGDLSFNFSLDENLELTADGLFNHLQEYFERPENRLNVYFNTKNIAQGLKEELNAEGITINGGGTTTLDANSLTSALYSVLLGQVPSGVLAGGGDVARSGANIVPPNLDDETEEAVASGQEYVKVLDETTIHIDKVIASLREFAKVASKPNASKGSKAIAGQLSDMGIDINRIRTGASDTDIIQMIQSALMTKDAMGHAKGSAIVGELQDMMSKHNMKPATGAGKVVETLRQDIKELFTINDIEAEVVKQVEDRLKQLSVWQGVEKPGRALASLGRIRSTKYQLSTGNVRTPSLEDFDKAIHFFEVAEENTDALKKFREAREKLGSGESEEAKAEFEQAAKTFYEESKIAFVRLSKQASMFKGMVYAEGHRPVEINPKGAYPYKMLDIPEDAVITKVLPYDPNNTVNEDAFTGGYNQRARKERQLYRGSTGYDYVVDRVIPKRNVRREEIEYSSFKPQEAIATATDVELDVLERQAKEVPELINRINEGRKVVADLEEIKQQLESDISRMTIEDLPNISLGVFKQYTGRKADIDNIVKQADSALRDGSSFSVGSTSSLTQDQSFLTNRLQTVLSSVHNDSVASQELAKQIFEIEEAQKLSKEELERLRNQAADILKLQSDKRRAQQEIQSLKSRTDITDDIRNSLITQQQSNIDNVDRSLASLMELFNGRSTDPNFYRDLLFDRAAIEQRRVGLMTQKSEIDSRLESSKGSAKALIEKLRTASDGSNNQAAQEAEKIAAKLIEAKEKLYTEAATYAKILNDQNTDEGARKVALGQLQQALGALNRLQYDFATVQLYTPNQSFYTDDQRKKTEQWQKKYTNSEVVRLEKELKSLEEQLSKETDKTRSEELKKQIANTKRSLTKKKKSAMDNVVATSTTQLSNIDQQLLDERRKLSVDETSLQNAERSQTDFDAKTSDINFLNTYNELLKKEKTLLEEVNRLKKEGADASVISAKSSELRQVAEELDNFLDAEKKVERTAYAREEAVKYKSLLSTARRQRSAFDSDIQKLEDDENSINTYGMAGRAGARATNIAKSSITKQFMDSDYIRQLEEDARNETKRNIEQEAKDLIVAKRFVRDDFDDKVSEAMIKEGMNPWDKKQIEQFLKTTRGQQYANDYDVAINDLQRDFEEFEKSVWNQYEETVRSIREQAKQAFKDSFSTKDGVLSATFKKQDADGNWVDDVQTVDIKGEALARIAEAKKYIETERKPLDDMIADLEAQKKEAMRYGVLSEDDLKHDTRLKEIENLNKEISLKQEEKRGLEEELTDIQSDDSLDEKEQSKKSKAKQKEIDSLDQEIQRLEAQVENRTELINRQVQESQEAKMPENKIAKATEELARQKERLAQAEERVTQRKTEYDSAKGTEKEMYALESLNKAIRERDNLLGQIQTKEANIAKWTSQVEAQSVASYSTGAMPTGGIIGSVLSAVREVIGSIGVGADVDTEDLAKETTLQAILKVLGGVPSGDGGYGFGRRKVENEDTYKNLYKSWNVKPQDLDFDTVKTKAVALKQVIDTLYDEGKTDTQEFINAQTELSKLLSAWRNKIGKTTNPELYGKTGKENWMSYLTSGDTKIFDNLDNVELSNISQKNYLSRIKKVGVETPITTTEVKESEATLQIKDFDDFKLQAQALKQVIEALDVGSEEQIKAQTALVQVLQTWARNEASGFGGKLPNAKGWETYLTQTGVFDKIDTSITPLTNRQLNKGAKTKDVVVEKPVKQEKVDKKETKSDKKTETRVENKQSENRQATGGLIQLVSNLAKETTLLQVLSALQAVGTVEGGQTAPTAAGDLYNQFKALLFGSSVDDHERFAYMNSETSVMSGSVIGNIANISEELINALRAKYSDVQGFDTQIHTHGKDTGSYFSTEDYQQFSKEYEAGIKKQVLLTQDYVSVLDLSAVKSAEEVQALMNELIKAGDNAVAIRKVFENSKSGAIFETAKFDSLNADSLVKMIGVTGVASKGETAQVDTFVSKLQDARKKMSEAVGVGYLSKEDANLTEFDNILTKTQQISENIKNGATSYEAQKAELEQLANLATRYSDIIGKTIGKNKRFYAGDVAVESVNKQRNKIIGMFETEDDFNSSDIALVQQYNKAVQDLNTTYQNLANTQQLQDKNQQQALSQQASRVQTLGKHLVASINQTRQLEQAVLQSGTYMKNGEVVDLGGISDKLDVEQVKDLNSVMRDYVQNTLHQANIENVKFNSTKQQLTYTFRTSKSTVADMVVQYDAATNALYAYNKQERESLTGLKAFVQQIGAKTRSILQYTTSITSIYRVWGIIRQGVTYVREIDSALTELKKVTDETEETYDRFLDTASKTASKVGSTVKEIVSSTADWVRLGYSMQEAAGLAESTSVLLNVSEFQSIDDATSALTSTMQAFGYAAKDSMHVVDVMNEIGNNYAISSDGIATALQDSASSLMAANNSYQEAVALIASANRVVQDPNSVGAALRTISLRLRGTSTKELEEAGEDTTGVVESKSKLRTKIQGYTGVDILTDTGAYKSTYEILLEISKVWDNLTDQDRAGLLELIAGKTRSNTAAAILANTKDLEAAYESAQEAEGSAYDENEKYLDSIQGRIDLFNNSIQTMWNNALNDDIVKFIVNIGTGLIKLVDQLGLIKALVIAIGTYAIQKHFKGDLFGGLFGDKTETVSQMRQTLKELTQARDDAATELSKSPNSKRKQKKLNTAQSTLDSYEASVSPKIKEYDELNGKLKEAQANLDKYQKRLDNYQGTNKKTIKQYTDNVNKAKVEVNKLETELKKGEAQTNTTGNAGLSAGQKFKNGFKSAAQSVWQFSKQMIASMATMYVITTIMETIIGLGHQLEWVVDKINTTPEEAQEEFEQLNEELSGIQTELSNLDSELETTRKRIDELMSQGSLSFTEQEELDTLRAENNELERKIKLNKTLEQTKQQQVNSAAVVAIDKYLDNTSFTSDISRTEKQETWKKNGEALGKVAGGIIAATLIAIGALGSGVTFGTSTGLIALGAGMLVGGTVGGIVGSGLAGTSYDSDQTVGEAMDSMLANRTKLQKQQSEAIANSDTEAYNEATQALATYDEQMAKHISQIQENYNAMDWSTATTEEQEKMKEYADWLDKYSISMGTTGAKTNALDRIFGEEADQELKNIKQQIQDIVKAENWDGNLDLSEMLDDNFITRLREMGIYVYEVENYFKDMAKAEEEAGEVSLYGVVTDIQKITDGLDSLKSAFEEVRESGSVTAKTLTELNEEFGTLGDSWDNYVNTMFSGVASTKEMQEATEELAKAFIDSKILTGEAISEYERMAYIIQLRNLGVTNAEEYVDDKIQENAYKAIQNSSTYNEGDLETNFGELTNDQKKELGIEGKTFDDLSTEELEKIAEYYKMSKEINAETAQEIAEEYGIEIDNLNEVITLLEQKEQAEKKAADAKKAQTQYDEWVNDDGNYKQTLEALEEIQKKYEGMDISTLGYSSFLDMYSYEDQDGATHYIQMAEEEYEKIKAAYEKFEELRNSEEGKKWLNEDGTLKEGVEAEFAAAYDAAKKGVDDLQSQIETELTADIKLKLEVVEASQAVDDIQSVYDDLKNAQKEYNKGGYLSVDTMQALLGLEPKYLTLLYDENGQLNLNEQALLRVAEARIIDMGITQQKAILEEGMRLATEGSRDALLEYITVIENATAANGDFVESQLAAIKAQLQSRTIAKTETRTEKTWWGGTKEVTVEVAPDLSEAEANQIYEGIKSQVDAVQYTVDLGIAGLPKGGLGSGSSSSSNEDSALEKLQKKYERKISNLDNQQTYLENEIERLEAEKKPISKSYYEEQIAIEEKKRNLLQQQRTELTSLLHSTAEGSDDWWDISAALWETEHAIQKSTLRMVEFRQSIIDLYKTAFDDLMEAYGNKDDFLTDQQDYLEKYSQLMELQGTPVSASAITEQMSIEEEKLAGNIAQLESLQTTLADAMANGELKEGSEEWIEMQDEIRATEAAILDNKIAIEEYREELKQLELDAFNMVRDAFSFKDDFYTNQQNYIEGYADYLEASGLDVPTTLYSELIAIETEKMANTLANLVDARARFAEMEKKGLDASDEEYREAYNTLVELEKQYQDNTLVVKQWMNEIREANFEKFDNFADRLDDLNSELGHLYNLTSKEDVALDDGTWTDEGITSLGLLYHQMELNKRTSQEYEEEIKKLKAAYALGTMSEKEYYARSQELKEGQWDAIEAYEDAKDSIVDLEEARIDMIEEGINEEIEAYEELIELKKEELEAERDLYEFKRDVEKQTKNIADLERRIASLSGSTNASDVAERRRLEAD